MQAPYDPSLSFLFFGEEMLQRVRMWRAGWDVFAPSEPVAFHLWSRAHRPTLLKDAGGSDNKEAQQAQQAQRRASQQRVLEALGAVGDNGGSGSGFDRGRGGTTGAALPLPGRGLDAFWAHCGIDFRVRTVSERALWGGRGAEAFQPSLQELLEGQAGPEA